MKSKEPVKKIFIGGISPDTPEEKIREYFQAFGEVFKNDLQTPVDFYSVVNRSFGVFQKEYICGGKKLRELNIFNMTFLLYILLN